MRILIVDDDELTLDALGLVLAKAGHQVDIARDGLQALDIVSEGRHRLVISDWVMPRMDGPELCRRIRSASLPGYVYIILLTAQEGIHYVVEGLSAGADDFLGKPFNADELRVRVRAGERILALETRDMAIFAMAKLAESRDPETGAHLERVRTYSQTLASWLAHQPGLRVRIDPEFVHLVYLTSPLHDIGKVGIPDSVLLKPGRLSDREFEIMKTHTTIGAETLGASLRQFPEARFLHMARDIALTHHERFDGAGYPQGLAGEQIPLSGRIVAVADVYDALTSKRVYKQALVHDIARSIIVQESGQQFDPDVVEAFIATEHTFVAVHEQFSEEEALAL